MRPKFLDVYRCRPLRKGFRTPLLTEEMWLEITCILFATAFVIGLIGGIVLDQNFLK